MKIRIVLSDIRICFISLRLGYFFIVHASGANGNSPDYAGMVLIETSGRKKIIIYLNAWAIVHTEVN